MNTRCRRQREHLLPLRQLTHGAASLDSLLSFCTRLPLASISQQTRACVRDDAPFAVDRAAKEREANAGQKKSDRVNLDRLYQVCVCVNV